MSTKASASKLSANDKERLIKAAFEAKEFAYNRYSNFRVGAALLCAPTTDGGEGEIVKGCNVENASYGGTICAERTAVVKGVSEGKTKFVGVAVVTDVPAPTSPCGICRQVLREFCALDTPILLVPAHYDPAAQPGEEKAPVEVTLEELLPRSFGPEDLEVPRVN